MFICQTTAEMNLAMLLDNTKADNIYYKKYGTGFLVLLRYTSSKNEKMHSTVDNWLSELDNELKRVNGSSATSFVSVSDVGSCKVRSFSGNDRINDYLFREIFDTSRLKRNGKDDECLRDGVMKWNSAVQGEGERVNNLARETNDLLVQQEAMAEDPDAYGGHTTLDSGSKMMVAREYAAAEERFGAASSSGGEGGVAEEEYAPTTTTEEDGDDEKTEGEFRSLNVELEHSKEEVRMLREASVKIEAKFAAEMEEVRVFFWKNSRFLTHSIF